MPVFWLYFLYQVKVYSSECPSVSEDYIRQTHIVVVLPLVSLMNDRIVILRAVEARPQSINNLWIRMLLRVFCISTGQSRSGSQLCPLQVSFKPWKCRVHLHLPSEGTRPLFSLGTLWTWTYLALLFVHYCPSLFTLPYELFFFVSSNYWPYSILSLFFEWIPPVSVYYLWTQTAEEYKVDLGTRLCVTCDSWSGSVGISKVPVISHTRVFSYNME